MTQMYKLIILATIAFATYTKGAFSPTGGSPLRISPNSAFRPVSRTGSTPVSGDSSSLALQTPPHIVDSSAMIRGAPAVIVPEFGHHPVSSAPTASASGPVFSSSAPAVFQFGAAASSFGGPTLPPFPVQQQAPFSASAGASLGFAHQLFPAFPSHAPSWVPGMSQLGHSEGGTHSKRRRVFNGLDGDA